MLPGFFASRGAARDHHGSKEVDTNDGQRATEEDGLAVRTVTAA